MANRLQLDEIYSSSKKFIHFQARRCSSGAEILLNDLPACVTAPDGDAAPQTVYYLASPVMAFS